MQINDQELFKKLGLFYRELSKEYTDVKSFGIYTNLNSALNSYLDTLKNEISRIRSYEKAEVQYYEISSLPGYNPPAFDKRIDGKIVKVTHALNLLNKLENVSSSEELEMIRPLLLAKKANYKKTIFPPFYLGCRATTMMSYK